MGDSRGSNNQLGDKTITETSKVTMTFRFVSLSLWSPVRDNLDTINQLGNETITKPNNS